MSFSQTLGARWAAFKARFEAWAQGEWTVVEATGSAILTGIETILVAAKPVVVADLTAVLQQLDREFLAGSTLDSIAEAAIEAAKTDGKAILATLEPRVLATLIGILVKAL